MVYYDLGTDMDLLTNGDLRAKKKYRDGLNFKRKRRKFHKEKATKILIFLGEILIVVFLAYWTVRGFGISTTIAGESMEETLFSGDVVLMNRIGSIRVNDIVVFQPSSNLSAQYSVKRVIGVPGDTVLIKNGNIYINGETFHNVTETESIEDAGLAGSEITLGEDEYFLLGDNRNNSEDSRYETIGNIHRDAIVGKVWFCVTLSNFGLIN